MERATKIEPVPGEPTRFFVESASRPGLRHLVDLEYDPEQRRPGAPTLAVCSCEDCQVRDRICRHIIAVIEWIKANDHLNVTEPETQERGV